MAELGGHPLVSAALAIAGKIAGQRRAQQSLFNAIRTNRAELARFRETPEIRFLAYAFAHREHSRSPLLQDLWVSWELDDRRDGTVVEIPTGRAASVAALLVDRLGWTRSTAGSDPIDLLVVEVGGDELRRLTEILAQSRPRLIIVELPRRSAAEIERLLNGAAYTRVFPQFSGSQGWYRATRPET